MPECANTWIVVPCYNEAHRLRQGEFSHFARDHPEIHLLFVDDGSNDETLDRLEEMASNNDAFSVVSQSPNQGKAEAVRRGMNEAFDRGGSQGPAYLGFWDADLATPLDEIPRFVSILDEHPELEVLFGSRVQLLGRTIERKASRHYVGRVAATAISLTLGLPVYDTQCGAKLFRASPHCKALFAEPFATRWLFDVEIIARMIRMNRAGEGPDPAVVVREIPLREWRDVAGSKVRPLDFFKSMIELLQIRSLYLRRS
jgi:glycosyltransferase involved in cell wall biosynthesis